MHFRILLVVVWSWLIKNNEKFLAYFSKNSETKVETDGVQIACVLSLATENVRSAELAFAKMKYKRHISVLRNT